MKKSAILLVFFLTIACYSQTVQKGRVFEKDSHRAPIENAEIVVKNAVPAVSGTDGKYKLVFKSKSPGEMIFVDSISKKGYELVNDSQVKDWILSDIKEFNIILCKKGLLKQSRENFYKVGRSRYEREYNQKQTEIEALKQINKLSESEYNNKLKEIYVERQKAFDMLDYYTDLFSRINKDDLSELERKAFDLTEQGKIDEAIQIYENEKLLSKFINNSTLKKKVSDDLESMIPTLYRFADIYIFAGGNANYIKAAEILRLVAISDTTKWTNTLKYAKFAYQLGRESESKMFYKITLRHTLNKLPILLEFGYQDYQNVEFLEEGLRQLKKTNANLDSVLAVTFEVANNFRQNNDIRMGKYYIEGADLICDSLLNKNYERYSSLCLSFLSGFLTSALYRESKIDSVYNKYKPYFQRSKQKNLEYEALFQSIKSDHYYELDNTLAKKYKYKYCLTLFELCKIDVEKNIWNFQTGLDYYRVRFDSTYNIVPLNKKLLDYYSNGVHFKEKLLICESLSSQLSWQDRYKEVLDFAEQGLEYAKKLTGSEFNEVSNALEELKRNEQNAKEFLKHGLEFVPEDEQILISKMLNILETKTVTIEKAEEIINVMRDLGDYYIDEKRFDRIINVIDTVKDVFIQFPKDKSYYEILDLLAGELFDKAFVLGRDHERIDLTKEIVQKIDSIYKINSVTNDPKILSSYNVYYIQIANLYKSMGEIDLSTFYNTKVREILLGLFVSNEEKYYNEYIKSIYAIKNTIDFEKYIAYYSDMISIIDKKYNGNVEFEKIKKYINYIIVFKKGTDYQSKVLIQTNVSNKLKIVEASESYYNEALKICKALVDVDPITYLSNLMNTFYSMALLYKNIEQFEKAETRYDEALNFCMQRISIDPKLFSEYLILCYNNLALFQKETKQFKKAENTLIKALEECRNLANKNSVNKQLVMKSLMNLAMFQKEINPLENVENYINEALDISRQLNSEYPEFYKSDIASCLANLALLQLEKKQFEKAEVNFSEALSFYGDLAYNDPVTFGPMAALCLTNLGITQSSIHSYKKAEENYSTAIKLYLELAKDFPNKFDSNLAINYGNLSFVQLNEKQFIKAEKSAINGIEIDSSQVWIKTNLAHALLFQGKYEEARKIYLEWKVKVYPQDASKAFKDMFLKDFDELEKAGITHPDIAKIRELLK